MKVPAYIPLSGIPPGIGKIDDAGVSVPNGRVDRHWQVVIPDKWTGEAKLRPIGEYMVDSDFFIDRFNLKFVEYGNWMNQQDRQNYLYNTSISFDDLARILGIEPDEIGLQKNLSMAFGARGQSKALAHFEQLNSAIINLTKNNGKKGVLAHEYGHAFDNLIGLAIFGDIRFVSGDTTRKYVDKDLLENGNQFQKWFELFFQALYYKSDGSRTTFYKKMVAVDSEYWENRIEIWARYFEQYISYQQRELNEENKFLCRPLKYYLKSRVYIPLEEFKAALPFAEKIIKNGLKLLLNKSSKITSHGVNKNQLPEHQQAQLKVNKKSRRDLQTEIKEQGGQMDLFNGILGAVEVLSQNTGIDYNGYSPDYEILSSYDHLIDKATNKIILYKKGGLDETIDAIKMVIANNYSQVAKLANHLKSNTPEQTAFNVWHFIKTYIKYDFDKPGMEEIRTPSRTWMDRGYRADCEDMAIFAGSIFKNLGIDFSLTIVGFKGTDFYQHIYVTVKGSKPIGSKDQYGKNEIVIDGVMARYGIHPDNIVRRMDINILGSAQAPVINGLGAMEPADSYTQSVLKLRVAMEEELANTKSAIAINQLQKEIRKATYIIMLNGTPEREVMMRLMHVIDDVTNAGFITWKKEADLTKVAEFLKTSNEIIEEGEEEQINGLFKKIGDGIKKAANNVGDFVKRNVNSAIDDVKTAAEKVKDAVMKYNPATVLIRNSFLGLLNLNFLKMASKLGWGYVSIEDATARRYNPQKYLKAINRRKEVENIFEKFGGDKSSLKKAVKNGAAKGGVHFSGLGEVAVGTIIAAAAPIVTIVVAKLLDVKPPEGGEVPITDEEANEEKNFIEQGKDLWDQYGGNVQDFITQFQNRNSSGGSNQGNTPPSNNNSSNNNSSNSNSGNNGDDKSETPAWVIPLVLTSLAAGGIFLYTRTN